MSNDQISNFYNKYRFIINVILFGIVVYILYKLYQKIFDKNNTTSGVIGQLTGNSSGSNIALNETAGGTFQSGSKYPTAVIKLVDLIYEKCSGYNLYVYPEVVNRLANLSVTDLKNAAHYWGDKYKNGEGKNLYQFIDAEWHNGMYKPALGALKKTGYYGN
jgi:hypothetical protein